MSSCGQLYRVRSDLATGVAACRGQSVLDFVLHDANHRLAIKPRRAGGRLSVRFEG